MGFNIYLAINNVNWLSVDQSVLISSYYLDDNVLIRVISWVNEPNSASHYSAPGENNDCWFFHILCIN